MKSVTGFSYGSLSKESWSGDLANGFSECFRVLKPFGTLIFKWNEVDIPLQDVLALAPYEPLYGHRTGKSAKTHWVAFMKPGQEAEANAF
jgi:SAM-dependent methyltransferase